MLRKYIFAVLGLIVLRLIFPERGFDVIGLSALANAVFALGFLLSVSVLACAIGLKIIRALHIDALTSLERILFAGPLGFGIVSTGILVLGLLGLLQTWILAAMLLGIGMLARREFSEVERSVKMGWRSGREVWCCLGGAGKVLIVLVSLLWLMAFIHALAPPWDYDGLMYHLAAPQRYLQAGRLLILPDTWQANGPSAPDLLYLLGLSFGTDTFAKLLHLLFGAWLVLGVYALGTRKLGQTGGWLAAILVMSMPIYFIWASWANTDMFVSMFEFMAIFAIVLWLDSDRSSRWLVLAGTLLGLALSSKYLTLGAAAVLTVWVIWHARRSGGRGVLRHVICLIGPAVLIASPWYVRNLIETGNPVYPLVWGGPQWDKARLDLVMNFLNSFGTGHGLSDYVLLPINLFLNRMAYNTWWGQFEFLNPLFLLALLYPFTSRPRPFDGLAGVAALSFVAWAIGSQQLRFLLPIIPLMALLTSYVLLTLSHRLAPHLTASYGPWLVALMLVIVPLARSFSLWAQVQPLGVVVGVESKDAFLRRNVSMFPVIEYLRTNTSAEARALMMWNGRGYYCDQRCVPDPEQSRWTYWLQGVTDEQVAAQRLRDKGITHLILDYDEVLFFERHDPTGQYRAAMDFFSQKFRPACTREIYSDQLATLYEVTC